jgi:hypothetical protein
VGEDGNVYAHLSYESWNQFPSPDWRTMQAANAALIARAPDLLGVAQELFDVMEHRIVDEVAFRIGARGKLLAVIADVERGAA